MVEEFTPTVCAACGVRFCMTAHLENERRLDGGTFFCPNGHSLHYSRSHIGKLREEADGLRRERDRLKQDQARLEQELAAAQAAERNAVAAAERVRNRAKAALCPCCNRSFSQLARHMKLKHPELVALPPRKMARKATS